MDENKADIENCRSIFTRGSTGEKETNMAHKFLSFLFSSIISEKETDCVKSDVVFGVRC